MSVSIVELWLAIFVAGFLCWLASALIHMLLKYHNADYKELSNEEEVSTALRASAPTPALYNLPYCADIQDMSEKAMQDKFTAGPVAMVSVMPNGMPAMGKLLFQQILFFIFGSVLIGYLASLAMISGTDYLIVFKHVFVTAFLAYGWAQIPYSIWLGQPWSNCMRYLLDAIIYASVTASSFAWLWPEPF